MFLFYSLCFYFTVSASLTFGSFGEIFSALMHDTKFQLAIVKKSKSNIQAQCKMFEFSKIRFWLLLHLLAEWISIYREDAFLVKCNVIEYSDHSIWSFTKLNQAGSMFHAGNQRCKLELQCKHIELPKTPKTWNNFKNIKKNCILY